MKKETERILKKMLVDNPILSECKDDIVEAFNVLVKCYKNKGMVLICGNGGSASDSEHIVGELMKGFLKKRPLSDIDKKVIGDPDLYENMQGTLPAISLVSQTSISSAFINDVKPDMVYAQQVYGYKHINNVVVGLTTSGNSKNVVNAMKVAKAFNMKTIGLTGKEGGKLKDICDVVIKVPANETYRVQEYHLPVYHALCAMIEEEFFDK